jgi:glutamine---fructose-6-phosphate transaminase (isomerizing)
MCGIIGLISNFESSKTILEGLKQLQNRGYDSAGICMNLNQKFLIEKYSSKDNETAISKLNNNLHNLKDSNIGIGHTRWATHGSKNDINSHPHISSDGKFCLVHNGIIENYMEIKNFLIRENYKFKSQTDSEVIVNLLAYNYKSVNNIENAIKKTINKLEGTWGLAILFLNDVNTIYCTRHGSPLLVSSNENLSMVVSEQSGFCGLVNNYIVLENNDICILKKNSINTTISYSKKDINLSIYDLSPKPFKYWTEKEINEQLYSSERAISLGGRLIQNRIKLGGIENHKEILSTIDNLILLGCGTSYNAGQIGTYYFKELCNFNTVQIFDGAEFSNKDIPKNGKTALILLSQSGETLDLVRCINIGKDNNLFLIGIVNVVDSLIARSVNCGCYLNAGREVAVASTKSFTSQVIILSMLSVWFSQIHNKKETIREKYIMDLRNLKMAIEKTIKISYQKIEQILEYFNHNSCFLLGKGKCEFIAKEGALKIKEICYIHAEGYSSSSLKHGPFALLYKDFPVIIIALDDENYNKIENAIQEVLAREAKVIIITNKKINVVSPNITIINLPYNKTYGDLLSIIPIQLLAFKLSVQKNINPDMPRNLAKVVTVE